jgi:type I restriction enzyme S subunit
VDGRAGTKRHGWKAIKDYASCTVLQFLEVVMVPNGWERINIDQILTIGSGKDYKHLSSGDIPVYGSGGHMLNVSEYLYDGESVCIGRKGTIDKPMLLDGKFWTVDTLFFTHSFKNTIPQYVYQYFLTINWRKYSEASGVPSLSKAIIQNIKINLPSLPEQRKIAKILSTWDKAITTTEQLIATSQQQKKSLMQQLLTGKKRLVRSPEKKGETGMVFEGDWEEVKLGDICDVKGGKRLPKGESLQENANAYPYIRVTDMHMGGIEATNILYVPEHIAPSIKNYTISASDLFITVAGTLGLVGRIPDKLDGANLTENADKLTNIKCDQTFLMYILMSPIIQKYIEAESTQNAQPKLALARIRGFIFMLPQEDEQQKIASVLTAADKEIELLQAKLTHLKQEKKALMQQLLTGKKRVSL